MKSYIAHCSNEVFCWDRRVYVDERLAAMPAAQAGIIRRGDSVFLISYETKVAEIVGGWLHVYGLFSRTTGKHLSAFLKQFAPAVGYYTAKQCALDDVEVNVKTGEIRPASAGMVQTVGVAC